jgi:hypothetical protein
MKNKGGDSTSKSKLEPSKNQFPLENSFWLVSYRSKLHDDTRIKCTKQVSMWTQKSHLGNNPKQNVTLHNQT